jgi:signal transduction histidine kinase
MYLLKLFVQNADQAIRNAELNDKLLQKEKLSAVGQVMGMVMHDLRCPIKNIKLLNNMLREEIGNNELIDTIDQSAEQASEIFDDFLDFINNTPVEKNPLNLNEIAAEAVKLSQSREDTTHTVIKLNIPADLIVRGDESKLRRTISNLVNNAVDVLQGKKGGEINISANVIDNMAVLNISDNGPGIPPEILNTLFDPFVTKSKSTGTGLGLAIVKQYVNAHGGNITVKNNNGAVFTISLPL